MDPNTTYALWLDAVAAGDRLAANEHYLDLRRWMMKGGFEPRIFSEPKTRKHFFSYKMNTGKCRLSEIA